MQSEKPHELLVYLAFITFIIMFYYYDYYSDVIFSLIEKTAFCCVYHVMSELDLV